MGQPLRVLIVEDSDADAELLLHALRRSGFEVLYKRVDALAGMRTALEYPDWDIVISDHLMPGFNSLAALAVCKEMRPDLPFLIVSGEIDLDLAVSVMRAGAQDYISKRELVRLGPAVEREMREVETLRKRRRAETAVRDERERARQYLGVVEVMLLALNDRGEVTLLNQKACRILGYTQEELVGLNWFDICVPAPVRENVREVFHRLVGGEMESVEYYENAVLTRAGEERKVAWHNVLLRDDAGRVTGTLSAGDDITERRRTEVALHECMALQQDLVDQIKQPFFSLDLDLRLTSWNCAGAAWGGLPAENRGEWTLEQVFPDPATSRRIKETCRLVLADRVCRTLSIPGRSGDNQTTLEVKVRPIRHGLYLLFGEP